MRYIERQVLETMNSFKRQGAKRARAEEVKKICRFANWAFENYPGVKSIENLGVRHLEAFLTHQANQGRSKTTLNKYYLSTEWCGKKGFFVLFSQNKHAEQWCWAWRE